MENNLKLISNITNNSYKVQNSNKFRNTKNQSYSIEKLALEYSEINNFLLSNSFGGIRVEICSEKEFIKHPNTGKFLEVIDER